MRDRQSDRIDTIKDLLLRLKVLEEGREEIELELKRKEKVWMKNDEGEDVKFEFGF